MSSFTSTRSVRDFHIWLHTQGAMTTLQAVVLGIVQGLTEFLPVSSSGHLALVPVLLNWDPEQFTLSFNVALHVGTLFAVLWSFREDWIKMTAALVRALRLGRASSLDEKRAIFLFIALLPAVAGGLLLEDISERASRSPLIIAAALILLGIVLWVVDRTATTRRHLDAMRGRDALWIGVAQVLALIPGVSRSGATMTAGRFLGFDRHSAARFSFLMSMPVIAAAAVLKVPDALREQGLSTQLLAGMAAAAITGMIAIEFLLRFLTTRGFGVFALYRIVLGVAVYILAYANG